MATEDPADSLQRAREQLNRAEADPDDDSNVFVWSFWALENAITAAANHVGVSFVKAHWSKAQAARRLAKTAGLPDVSDLLSDLNEARKETAYGDAEETDLDSGDVLDSLREYIQKVDGLLKRKKKK